MILALTRPPRSAMILALTRPSRSADLVMLVLQYCRHTEGVVFQEAGLAKQGKPSPPSLP